MIGRKIFAPSKTGRQVKERYGREEEPEASAVDMSSAGIRMRARYGIATDSTAVAGGVAVAAAPSRQAAKKRAKPAPKKASKKPAAKKRAKPAPKKASKKPAKKR